MQLRQVYEGDVCDSLQQQQQPAGAQPEKEEPVKRRPTAEPISLFGANEEEDEEEDLFAERTTPPTQLADSQSSHSVHSASWSTGSKGDTESAPAGQSEAIVEEHVTKPRAGSRFLFDQEDDLFKSSEDALDVDLFAPPAAKVMILGQYFSLFFAFYRAALLNASGKQCNKYLGRERKAGWCPLAGAVVEGS